LEKVQGRSNGTSTWRGIWENWSHLKKGVGHTVANVQATKFGKQPWASTQMLLSMTLKEVPHDIQDALVMEYWAANRGWQWEKFSEYLPNEALSKIASHELIMDNGAEDKIY